jgi:hypothetical protein
VVTWLPRGFEFLSGLPTPVRKRRKLMVIQAFVDDSGGKGHSRHFVLAGLVGSASDWGEFSDEWRAVLNEPPAIRCFKMREAAGRPTGQFHGMSESQRDKKLSRQAKVINRHGSLATYSIIDLDAHAKTWTSNDKPQNDPYFWPYQKHHNGGLLHPVGSGMARAV